MGGDKVDLTNNSEKLLMALIDALGFDVEAHTKKVNTPSHAGFAGSVPPIETEVEVVTGYTLHKKMKK